MTQELRCPGRIHGIIEDDDICEIKCHSRACGAKSGVVVLHYFNLKSGELVDTKVFRDAHDLQMITDKKEKAV